MDMAAIVFSAVLEEAGTPGTRQPVLVEFTRGLGFLRQYHWFRRFLLGRLLLVSVELAIPFYAIHAATLHDPSALNLSVFVCALSLGLVLAGPLWGRWMSTSSHRVMAGGAFLAAMAGVLTLIVDVVPSLHIPYIHAVVVMILALGRQGVIQARIYYLSVQAPASDRPLYIAVSDGLIGIWSILFVFPLGWAAHLHHILLPLTGLIVLNVVAAFYVGRALKIGA